MHLEDTVFEAAPETVAQPEATPAEDSIEQQAAPQPVVPPELISAVTQAVAGELRTLHGEIRRQQSELRTLLQQPPSVARNEEIEDLSARFDEMSAGLVTLAGAVLPEEQQQAFKHQQEVSKLQRQLKAAQTPPPAPATPQPVPAQAEPDPQQQAQVANAQVVVANFAEGLGIDLNSVTEAERLVLVQNVPQHDIGLMVNALKANLRTLAQQRAAPPQPTAEEQQAQTRQQVRQSTSMPASRGSTTAARKVFRTEADWRNAHARGEITTDEARHWQAQNLPFN